MRLLPALLFLLAACLATGCLNRGDFYADLRQEREEAYQKWATITDRDENNQAVLEGRLALQDALAIALLNNKNIQIALEEKARARGRVMQGYSEALPSLLLSGTYNRLSNPPDVAIDPVTGDPMEQTDDTYEYALTFTQPIFRGFRIGAAIRTGLINALLADEQVRGTTERVIEAVATAYYDALLAQELYLVNKSALESAQGHLDDVLARKRAGVATQLDVLRAEVEASNVRSDMIAQQNAIGLTKAQMLRLMGVSQRSEIELATQLEFRPIKPVLDAAVKVAYENRPDLYFAEMDIRLQREAVTIAKSRRFPSLEFFYQHSWTRPDQNRRENDSWSNQSVLGLNLNWTLFDGFRREGEIAEQEAVYRQRIISLADTEEQALLELRQALINIRNAEEVLEAQELNVERAKESLRLAEVGFPEVTTEVEVTDARAAMVRAKGLYWQAVRDHAVARLVLQRSMGLLAPQPGSSDIPDVPPAPGEIPQFMDKRLEAVPDEGAPGTPPRGTTNEPTPYDPGEEPADPEPETGERTRDELPPIVPAE